MHQLIYGKMHRLTNSVVAPKKKKKACVSSVCGSPKRRPRGCLLLSLQSNNTSEIAAQEERNKSEGIGKERFEGGGRALCPLPSFHLLDSSRGPFSFPSASA